MGLIFRKRKNMGKNSWLNFSGSGVSASRRFGPVTLNSRGGFFFNFGRGLSFRGRWKK